MKLQIIYEGNPILRNVSSEVEVFDDKLAELLDEMQDLMKSSRGVGIAAPQVGKNIRAFIVNVGDKVVEYINPTVTEQEGEQSGVEGCLSVPGRMGVVTRPKVIKGFAFNRKGERFEFEAKDLEARAILHENDHLDGVLYTDKATKIFSKKRLILRTVLVTAGVIAVLGAVVITLFSIFN